MSARRLLPAAVAALVLFGLAALLTGDGRPPRGGGARVRGDCRCSCVQAFRGAARRAGELRDYVTLTKPRVMSLLLLTGGAAVFVGASGVPGWGIFAADDGRARARLRRRGDAQPLPRPRHRQADGRAHRTTGPSPRAASRPELALEFGIALSALSFVLLDSLVNLPTALLALAGNLFYVLVYTRWLKRSTPQNIVIGGAAGAVPPLVGYAGAAGHLGWAALVMFGIVFLWTPPHFWALALMIREHYANAERADAAGRARRARDGAADRVVHGRARRGDARAGRVRRLRARLRRSRRSCSARCSRGWRSRSGARRRGRTRSKLFHYSMLYLALLFVAMALDVVV